MIADPLTAALRRLRRRSQLPAASPPVGKGQQSVDPKPCCPFDAVLEQRQTELERELSEVRSRINGLIFLLADTVLTQVVLKILT